VLLQIQYKLTFFLIPKLFGLFFLAAGLFPTIFTVQKTEQHNFIEHLYQLPDTRSTTNLGF